MGIHATILAVAVMAATTPTPPPPAPASSRESPALAERYFVNGDAAQVVTVSRLARDAYLVVGKGWDGVGMLSGSSYWGVFRQSWGLSGDGPPETRGTHRGQLRRDGTLAIRGDYVSGLSGSFQVTWTREARPTVVPPPPSGPAPDRPPDPGDYVYVEELPEAVTKVPPVYPEAARRAKIEGTVLVQALVGKDGTVKNTRVTKSIPGLDEAAVEAVRQWVFKPALSKGSPIEVWVAVPVRFPPP